MRTVVISGGTDGIGKGLALALLRQGERVIVIGRDAKKGQSFVDAAGFDEGARAIFIQADLSLVEENDRVLDQIRATSPVVDALILCARHFRSARRETPEGFEDNLALFYLSRYVLSHGLAGQLERATRPVIVNIAGPGTDLSAVHWDDLGLARGYDGVAALMQGGKLNDLLGVTFADQHRAGRIRYVLYGPATTSTSFSGEYDASTAVQIETMKRLGRPVAETVEPILACVDEPPAEPLSAFVDGRRMSVEGGSFDRAAATRLAEVTQKLLASHAAGPR